MGISYAKTISSIAILAWILGAVVGCEKQVRVPTSAYSSLDAQGALEWEVSTTDKTYRTERLAATDSSLILQGGVSVKDRNSGGYPSAVWSRMNNAGRSIVLSLDEVQSVDRVERAKVRTIVAKTSVVVVVVGGITLFVWAVSGLPGNVD